MRRILFAIVCFLFLSGGTAEAGGYWRYYGGTYYQGTQYHGACNYGGHSYQPGYWYYYETPVYLTAFVQPIYIATAAVQYQPVQATTTYQTNSLASVQAQTATVTETRTQQGVAQTAQSSALAVSAPTGCHAEVAALKVELSKQKTEFAAFMLDFRLSQAKSAEEENAILRNEILRQRGLPPESVPSAPRPAPTPAPPTGREGSDDENANIQAAAGILVTHCADCHHAKVAGQRKGGFVLFDDKKDGTPGVQVLNPGPDQLDAVLAAIVSTGSDAMPPPTKRDKYPALTTAEVGKVRWLAGKMKVAKQGKKEPAPMPKAQDSPGEAKKP